MQRRMKVKKVLPLTVVTVQVLERKLVRGSLKKTVENNIHLTCQLVLSFIYDAIFYLWCFFQ